MSATMTTQTTKVLASDLKIGDVIMPPEREQRLWMRRTLAEEGRPESDLHITITSIEQGKPDKNGAWLIVRGSGAFLNVGGWTIKMLPHTLWPVVQRASAPESTDEDLGYVDGSMAPGKPLADLTWTEHTSRCTSCGDLFRISQETLDSQRENFDTGDSTDAEIAASFEFCFECVDGIRYEREKSGLEPDSRAINYDDLGREHIRSLDQALYVASCFAGNSPTNEVAILCRIFGDREKYAVLDTPLLSFRNTKGRDMLAAGWSVSFILRKPV